MSDFNPGDVVYLKVGSPPLVVSGHRGGDGLITVQWFSGHDVKTDRFDAECLIAETPELEYARHQRNGNIRIRETGIVESTGEIIPLSEFTATV